MEEVIAFAKKKHEGQIRKFSKEPYIAHPIRVATTLEKLGEADELIKAAYLHDTIEDTNTTFEEIKEKFGEKIANLVLELTKNRSEIEQIGKTQHLIKSTNTMSPGALTIKLADRLDNVSDLDQADQEFKEKYAKETQQILENLERKLSETQQKLYDSTLKMIKNVLKLPTNDTEVSLD